MSIDFSKIQDLTIPEGVVVQIEDSEGRILWAMLTATDEPAAIFEVAKQTNNSYDGETVYEDNNFILLDIYPKKYGTVTVTYGGVTRTITDESGVAEPNAQQVCFGRFSGQTYDETPASGRVTIEGAYRGYGAGSYNFKNSTTGKSNSTYAHCLTGIVDFGNPVYIGTETFAYCDFLTSITLPGNLENIAYHLFSYSKNLAEVIVPKSVKSIGSQPFYYGNDTMTVILRGFPADTSPLDLEYNGSDFRYNIDVRYEVDNFNWDDWAMHIPATIHETVDDTVNPYKYYDRYVYINGTGVREITSVSLVSCEFIADYAFNGFWALTSINIPNSVRSIGANAFKTCTSLSSVTMQNGVKSIGDSAFDSCSKLTSITIPDSVTSIGEKAFYQCARLTSVVLPSGITSIGESTFFHCEGLTSITIPNTVTSIGKAAFQYCYALQTINIPEGVTIINEGTFSGCDSLKTITIPNTVTSIGDSAFYSCESFASITIPENVTSIGKNVFNQSLNLKSATFKNTTGWYVTKTKDGDASTGIAVDVTDPTNNAKMLRGTYSLDYYWYRS